MPKPLKLVLAAAVPLGLVAALLPSGRTPLPHRSQQGSAADQRARLNHPQIPLAIEGGAMKLCHDLVVLVADGTHMLLLRNQGDEVYPDLRVIQHRKFDNPPNREILSDAPGVGFSAAYPGRDTVARGDPHQLNEDRFLIGAARALADVAEEATAVMVVAPPHALGQLRQHYDDNIRARLVAEVDKDLVKHPVEEITRRLSA